MRTVTSTKALAFTAFIAPTLCVVGVRLLGSGAAHANASEPVVPKQVFTFPAIEDPRRTLDTIDYTQFNSPLHFDQVYAEAQPQPQLDQAPRVPVPRVELRLPEFSVTSILPSPKNPLAVIEGKPRRIGDMISDGWIVESINGDDFTVTFVHDTGKKIDVKLSKKP
jgi:hypothetical protein